MKTSTIRAIAFTAVTLTTVGFIGATIASRSFAKEPVTVKQTPSWENYDWAKSEDNLRRIGQALQNYRSFNGTRPVEQRQGHEDAGFHREPAAIGTILTKADKPWTIAKSLFLAPTNVHRTVGRSSATPSDYVCLIRPNPNNDPYYATTEEVAAAWSARGEDLPILVDINMHEPEAFNRSSNLERPILIMRLDGRVEQIIAHVANMREILLEK